VRLRLFLREERRTGSWTAPSSLSVIEKTPKNLSAFSPNSPGRVAPGATRTEVEEPLQEATTRLTRPGHCAAVGAFAAARGFRSQEAPNQRFNGSPRPWPDHPPPLGALCWLVPTPAVGVSCSPHGGFLRSREPRPLPTVFPRGTTRAPGGTNRPAFQLSIVAPSMSRRSPCASGRCRREKRRRGLIRGARINRRRT